MWKTWILAAALAMATAAQNLPEPRYLVEPGWKPLLNGRDLEGWHAADGKPLEWFATTAVRWDRESAPFALHAQPAAGGLILNSAAGKTANLVSDATFGDVELYLEFFLARGSNSGVYVHGLYEVQVKDSYGVEHPTSHDCGGIYERQVPGKGGVGGTAPLRNASKPAGEWQTFEIRFRAPRFDAAGRKIENARFLRVLHNGILVQDNVEAEGPTTSPLPIVEAPSNPLMLQGDHGPVAYRNIYIRPLR
ncbi:MAG: DUF1080 domain-containing protein [Candidatus Solibacter sp.]|jgi:hypothetical protein